MKNKLIRDLKTWKAIIQFVITVLTAILSSFFVQSCIQQRNGQQAETPHPATPATTGRSSMTPTAGQHEWNLTTRNADSHEED